MFDSSLDRTLSWRLGLVYDYSGVRRTVRRGIRNGIWYLDPTSISEAAVQDPDDGLQDASARRLRALDGLHTSGLFTPLELATLRALAIEQLTIAEVATRDRCSRQAVMARLVGNSRGQGGILRKALRLHGLSDHDPLATS